MEWSVDINEPSMYHRSHAVGGCINSTSLACMFCVVRYVYLCTYNTSLSACHWLLSACIHFLLQPSLLCAIILACCCLLMAWVTQIGVHWGSEMSILCTIQWRASIILQWFSASEFGTWYSVMNTTMNLACSIGPVLTVYLTIATSWQTGMAASGKRNGLQWTSVFLPQSSSDP